MHGRDGMQSLLAMPLAARDSTRQESGGGVVDRASPVLYLALAGLAGGPRRRRGDHRPERDTAAPHRTALAICPHPSLDPTCMPSLPACRCRDHHHPRSTTDTKHKPKRICAYPPLGLGSSGGTTYDTTLGDRQQPVASRPRDDVPPARPRPQREFIAAAAQLSRLVA